jgi:hypothetical protein
MIKKELLAIIAILITIIVFFNHAQSVNGLEGFYGDKRSKKEKETIMIVFTSIFGAICIGVAIMAIVSPLTISPEYYKSK